MLIKSTKKYDFHTKSRIIFILISEHHRVSKVKQAVRWNANQMQVGEGNFVITVIPLKSACHRIIKFIVSWSTSVHMFT